MKKKVMIVGAGAGQVPLIELCKAKGYFTYVVSPKGPYPGVEIADYHFDEDIYNVDSLVDFARDKEMDYVISDQSDYAVPIVAYVSEKLNLPGNRLETAETYSYKSKFRRFCRDNGIPAPKAVVAGDMNDVADLRYPVIVKPVDSQGSRGIRKVETPECLGEAIAYALNYSKKKSVIIEEYFAGKEIVCEGFALEGKYFPVAFGDRNYFDIKDKFIPSQTVFPSSISTGIKEKIIANESRITSLLKPEFGIVHSEYIVDEETGDFVVVESALRGGGVYIASDLIPLSVGVNLTEVLFNAMTGERNSVISMLTNKKKKASAYICFYLKKGIVTSINGADKIMEITNISRADIGDIHVGDKIEKIEHKGMRKGPFIIYADSLSDLETIKEKIMNTYSIDIDNRKGICW